MLRYAIAALACVCFLASAVAQTAVRPPPAEQKYKVPKDLADKVQALLARNEADKAIALVDKALEDDRGNPELYLLRAQLQCRVRKFTLCVEDAGRAVDADKEYAKAYLFRGLAHVDAGQPREGIFDCEIVIRLRPESPIGYNCRGVANRALRDFPQAIADFDEALSKDGKFALAHYNKGLTHVQENQLDAAIESFSAAIKLNDKHADSFAQRGKARMAKGDVTGARADFSNSLALDGRNHDAAVGIQALQVGKALDILAGKK